MVVDFSDMKNPPKERDAVILVPIGAVKGEFAPPIVDVRYSATLHTDKMRLVVDADGGPFMGFSLEIDLTLLKVVKKAPLRAMDAKKLEKIK